MHAASEHTVLQSSFLIQTQMSFSVVIGLEQATSSSHLIIVQRDVRHGLSKCAQGHWAQKAVLIPAGEDMLGSSGFVIEDGIWALW